MTNFIINELRQLPLEYIAGGLSYGVLMFYVIAHKLATR